MPTSSSIRRLTKCSGWCRSKRCFAARRWSSPTTAVVARWSARSTARRSWPWAIRWRWPRRSIACWPRRRPGAHGPPSGAAAVARTVWRIGGGRTSRCPVSRSPRSLTPASRWSCPCSTARGGCPTCWRRSAPSWRIGRTRSSWSTTAVATSRSRSAVGVATPTSQVVDGPRRGAAAAVNTGLRLARFDLVAQIDQDVIVRPGWFDALIDALARPAASRPRKGGTSRDPAAPALARVMSIDLEQRYARIDDGRSDHVCTGNVIWRLDALRQGRRARRDAGLRVRQRLELSPDRRRLPPGDSS